MSTIHKIWALVVVHRDGSEMLVVTIDPGTDMLTPAVTDKEEVREIFLKMAPEAANAFGGDAVLREFSIVNDLARFHPSGPNQPS